MRTTIDGGGRVVIPKRIRDALDLRAGAEVDVALVDGRIEIDMPATPMRLEERNGRVVATTDHPMPVLTAAEVRAVLEQTRR